MKDRKTDNLLNAIGALPDFLIDESSEGSEEMKNRNITKWATVAAVFVFAALTCVFFALRGKPPAVTPSDTESAYTDSGETTDPASDHTSAPESTSAPETTKTEPPEEPTVKSEVFKLESSAISFPVTPTSDKVRSMLANGGVLDAQDGAPHCPVFAVRSVDDLGSLKKELLSSAAADNYGIFESRSERFDDGFFGENTLYVSFVEASAFSSATAAAVIKDSGDKIEISFGFTNVGDFAYSTEPYCVFLTVPNSRAADLKTVDCTYGSGEYDHIATVRGVVTDISEGTATLRLIDDDGDIFSDAGILTFRSGGMTIDKGFAVEIGYNDTAEENTDGHIEKTLFVRQLDVKEVKLPEAVGKETVTRFFIETEDGNAMIENSGLNLNKRSADPGPDPVFGIGSEKELAEFCRLLADAMMTDDSYSFADFDELYAEEYEGYAAEFDKSFFRSHSLLIIYKYEPDTAEWFRPCKVERGADGTLTVSICRVAPSSRMYNRGATCIFIPVEKDVLADCTGVSVDCTGISFSDGGVGGDHAVTVRAVVTDSLAGTAALRLLDENGDIFSDVGTLTLGFTDSWLFRSSAVEITYDAKAVGNTDERINTVVSVRRLTSDDLELPDAVGEEVGTYFNIYDEEGYDILENSDLAVKNCYPESWQGSVFGVASTEELAAFYRLLADASMPEYGAFYTPDELYELFGEEYEESAEEYNESFFKSHSLLIFFYDLVESTDRRIPIKADFGEDGTLTVGICCVDPTLNMNDEVSTFVFVPVEKDDFKNCTGVKVESITVEEIVDW